MVLLKRDMVVCLYPNFNALGKGVMSFTNLHVFTLPLKDATYPKLEQDASMISEKKFQNPLDIMQLSDFLD